MATEEEDAQLLAEAIAAVQREEDEEMARMLQDQSNEELARQIQSQMDEETAKEQTIRSSMGDERANDFLSKPPLLFIDTRIDGKQIVMLVDTGAQVSIMSSSVVNQILCWQNRINKNLGGMAGGVGQGKILGKIADCEVYITPELDVSINFYVLEQSHHLCILGLDALQNLGCLIDLGRRQLIIGGPDGMPLNFLGQHEIPMQWNLSANMMGGKNCSIQ